MLRLSETKANCCVNHAEGNRRKVTTVSGWLLPSAFLLLIPKCPLCIVAYTAVGTGIGISVSTAAGIRYSMITACIGLLVFAVFRTIAQRTQITS